LKRAQQGPLQEDRISCEITISPSRSIHRPSTGRNANRPPAINSSALEIIGDQIQRVSAAGEGALSVSFVLGLATAVWGANAGVKAMGAELDAEIEKAAGEAHAQRPKNADLTTRTARSVLSRSAVNICG
jgi:hypothetical protein